MRPTGRCNLERRPWRYSRANYVVGDGGSPSRGQVSKIDLSSVLIGSPDTAPPLVAGVRFRIQGIGDTDGTLIAPNPTIVEAR